MLFHEDDAPDTLYVVIEGRIAIAKRSIDGRESVVALMEPGDLFGEMQLFETQGRSAEARALEQSQVLAIGYEPDPRGLRAPARAAVGRRRAAGRPPPQHGRGAGRLGVPRRHRPHRQAAASRWPAGADEFTLPVTQEELAAMVGASRERVNKAIASFVRLGWIEQSERRYRITDREQLERRAR